MAGAHWAEFIIITEVPAPARPLISVPFVFQIRANMTGINTLRHRPGLALEGKLVHSEDPSLLINAGK